MIEAERVERAIRAAFAGVDRAGGLCWAETVLQDRMEGDLMLHQKAREESRDRSWMELAEQPDWGHKLGFGRGGFAFLDPIGFRYYLAAAMVWVLRYEAPQFDVHNPPMWVAFALTLSDDAAEYRLGQWSELNGAQRWAAAEFVRFMKERDEEAWDGEEIWHGSSEWGKAWDSYWREVYEAGPVAPLSDPARGKKAAKRAIRRRIR